MVYVVGALCLRRLAFVIVLWLAQFPVMAKSLNADDDVQLKKRYFRFYMEYQNVEISGSIKEVRENAGTLEHDFVLRYGASHEGRIPPMEVFTLRPNPGEPHLKDKLLMDEAFAISDSFLNLQFRREYVSSHRFDKFFGADSTDRADKQRFSKAIRFSNIYLYQNATSPPGIFYAIQESVQMGLDGFDPKVYWGNERKFEAETKFEVLGTETFLGFPCLKVRYLHQNGIVVDALLATEPSFQLLKVLEVSGPADVLAEDDKSTWLNKPKTESIKRFGRWLMRDKVSYSDRDNKWVVTINDVKALPEDYQGLWSTYNSMTGVYLTGPAEPQTRKGTARVPVAKSKGYMMVPYTDDEKELIEAYVAESHRKLEAPTPSFVRVLVISLAVLSVCLLVVSLVKRTWQGR